jgi:Gas vesicle protein G
MGLLTGLLTLPLAPVRGTVWIAERIAEEAERQLDEEPAIRRALDELQVSYELGELGDEEFERQEDELLQRLIDVRAAAQAAEAEDTFLS